LQNKNKLLKKTSYALIFSLITFTAQAITEKDITWEIFKRKNGVTVYQGKHKDPKSGITPLKVSTILNHPPSRVIAVLVNSKRKLTWLPKLEESYPLEIISPFDRVEYSRYSSPWPFDDRTFVVKSTGVFDKKNQEVRIMIKSVDHPKAPKNKKYVRALTTFGVMRLKPLDNYTKTYYEMIFLSDFKGKIPIWIINMVSLNWPFKLFKALKRQLTKKDIVVPKEYYIKQYLENSNQI